MTPNLVWKKAADGTAAVDMQVALITSWYHVGPKDRPSFQNVWPATGTPVGTFGIQFSNGTDEPAYNGTATTYPAAAMSVAPTQPTGGADNNILCVDSIGEWVRETYTPGSGGAGALCTGFISFTEKIDL